MTTDSESYKKKRASLFRGSEEMNMFQGMAFSAEKSKTKYQKLITDEKLKTRSHQVLEFEKSINADRSTKSIGRFPSDLHTYEILSRNLIEMLAARRYEAAQIEMIIQLSKPKKMLFTDPQFWRTPFEYLEKEFDISIFVPNDENLYREEAIIMDKETQLNVLDPLDIQNGVIPNGIDLIITSFGYLTSNPNENILKDLYDALSDNGAIFIHNSNFFSVSYTSYAVGSLATKLHDDIRELTGSNSYHIPSFIGFTVVTKNLT